MLLLACAVSTLALPAAAAERGKYIGDGVSTPREFVAGRDPTKRAAEIKQWLVARGGNTERTCNAANKYCVTATTLRISNGRLAISHFEYFDGRSDWTAYCRANPAGDSEYCYGIQDDNYFVMVHDTKSGNWEKVWNEREKKDGAPSAPSKPAVDQFL